MLLYKSLFILP